VESGLQNRNQRWLTEARDELRDLVHIEPSAKPLLIRCLQALLIVDSGSALTYLEEALAVDGDHPAVLNNLGYVHQKMRGDYETAATYYRRCLDKHPHFAQAYLGLADVYAGSRAPNLEYKLLSTALTACPRDARVFLALGRSAAGLGKLPEAEERFAQCLEHCAGSDKGVVSAAQTEMADAKMRQGDTAAALRLLRESLALCPTNANAALRMLQVLQAEPPGDTESGDTESGDTESGDTESGDTTERRLDVQIVLAEALQPSPAPPICERNEDPSHHPKVGFLWNASVPACFTAWLFHALSWDVVVYTTDRNAPPPGKFSVRSVRDVTATGAAQVIRSDGVDVLVDLVGCRRGARPDILTMAPAARVMSYDPCGPNLGIPSVRPMAAGLCFANPFVGETGTGFVKGVTATGPYTLGYIGPLSHLSSSCVDTLVNTLRAAPDIRLVIFNAVFRDPEVHRRFLDLRFPVDLHKRAICLPHKDVPEHRIRMYRVFDAYVAPWPSCATEELLEALCMDVPVITKETRPARRSSEDFAEDFDAPRILRLCGLAIECVAADDRAFLNMIRHTRYRDRKPPYRERLGSSELVNRPKFLKKFEDSLMNGWICS
jgi:Tfp pilus assembly protein PilF